MKAKNSVQVANSYDVLLTLVKTLGRPFSFMNPNKMAQVENVEAQNLEYQKIEEVFEGRDVEVF